MKLIFVLAIIFSGLSAKSQQNFDLLADSLTNKKSRTWVQCNDTSLKQNGPACMRGKEYTFFKAGKKGVKKSCINGKWVENKFSWAIEKKDDSYLIHLINEGGVSDNFSIQLLKENNMVRTRLTQKDYDRKEVERLCNKNN